MADLLHLTATGTVVAVGKAINVFSVTLTPAAATATAVVRTGGASGTVKIALQAAADGNSVQWVAGDSDGALFANGVHVTITGVGALVDTEFEF